MQHIVIEEPYNFIAPRYSRFWHWVARQTVPGKLRKEEGITAIECVGVEKLRASLDAGRGIMLTPNHCRPLDPLVIDSLAAAAGRPFTGIASWHIFKNSRLQRFLLPRIGAFSVYREGTDRESLRCAVRTLAEGRHPLAVFVEGVISRSNDQLLDLMDGPAFMARTAAKKRDDGAVVIHPVFIRYFFEGDLQKSLDPVLGEIEKRLSWQPQSHMPLLERVIKLGDALLTTKEIEHLQSPRPGTRAERRRRLIEHLLGPLEEKWLSGRHDGDAIARAKRLRAAILPDMIEGEISARERAARWRSLAELYLVQQLHCYPADYLKNPTPERILETVDRYEEDLTDVARPHPPLRVVITVGDAIEVGATRDRSGESDPTMDEIRRQLESMMESSKAHRKVTPTGTGLS